MEAVRTDVIIVGAGPAGLAVGACLRRAGGDFLILEQSDRIGASWHRHYDRLHLHTDKGRSELPGLGYPAHYPRYPSREQVIAYLEGYAEHFNLNPRFNQRVVRASRQEGAWEVDTMDARYRSRFLVVASGYNGVPHVPTWPGQDEFQGHMQHSSQYKDGRPFRGQNVLVVGLGNSGGEIAIDLWEHGARPALAVRGPVNLIPRDVLGLPILALAIPLSKLPTRAADAVSAPILWWTIGDVHELGLQALPVGPLSQIEQCGRIPLIDVGTIDLIKQQQLAVRPGITRLTQTQVEFTDGRAESYDAVILATGYRPRVDRFLKGADQLLQDGGTPRVSGREAGLPGLYFCGFYVSPTGILREIASEAKRITADIQQRVADNATRR